jgi:hypothetical protein
VDVNFIVGGNLKQYRVIEKCHGDDIVYNLFDSYKSPGDRRGRDRIVVGLITTYAISAFHH